jgi:hypothetical protein
MTHVTKEFHRMCPNRFWGYGTFGANCGSILHGFYHYLQTDRKEILHDPHHLGVPSGASKIIKMSHCIQSDQNELPFEPRHLGVPSGASKTIYEAMVHLLQTVHLSYTETKTVSKWTKTSFHLSLVNQEYHPVHPKQFMSPWYVWHKLCTYHAPKLTLSLKGSKQRFYITHVSEEFHRVHPKRFLRLWYVWCKLWTYLALILTLSPNGPSRDSTWPTSHRSSIGYVEIVFWAYGTFGANRAPILNQD